MSNSWIDRDELEELVGACSKKKFRKLPVSKVSEVNHESGEELAAPGLSSEVIDEVEMEAEVEAEREPDPEVAADVGVVRETIPGLLISSPLLAEGVGTSLDLLDSLDDLSLQGMPEEEGEASALWNPDPLGEADSVVGMETIENLVIEDGAEAGEAESRAAFLGEALSLSPAFALVSRGSEAKRAVQSLADAREQANVSRLLKGDGPEAEVPAKVPLAEPEPDLEIADLKIAELERVKLKLTPAMPGALWQRFDDLATQLRRDFSAISCVFFDDLGNELYRSGEVTMRVGGALLLPSPWSLLEGHRAPGVAQVTSGDGGRWTCLVRGVPPAAHLRLQLELEEPAETNQLLVLPNLLADALYRQKDSIEL